MELEIRYDGGSMVVYLEEFLNARNITKVRKLLSLIRNSFTPEAEQQMKEFVQHTIEQFEERQQRVENFVAGYEQKVSYCQERLQDAMCARSAYKRSTPLYKSERWDEWNERVKEVRRELSELKNQLREYKSQRDNNIKNRAFYKTVLENIT